MPSRGDDASDDALAVSTLGGTVRFTRKRLGLSVQSLADSAGVSFGLVSELERGLGNPSLQSMRRIASALGLSVTQLLESPTEAVTLVPADRRHTLAAPTDAGGSPQAVRELLTPRGESAIQLIRSTLPPGFTNERRPFRHIGTECVTVEKGALVVVHGGVRLELGVGDTVTYVCSAPHWWANGHDAETVVLGAVTPLEN
jgi:transcriptional regulator with XRE-family HTH domain